MAFNSQQFLDNYSISYSTEGKNIGKGWIGIKCPFCDDPSQHGGFNIIKEYYNCWTCGYHRLIDVVLSLTGEDFKTAQNIIRKYSNTIPVPITTQQENRKKELMLPVGSGTLFYTHKTYLEKRGFDPDYLEKEWDLKGTGFIGEYKFRIIAPIYVNHKLVSYQGRDITERSPLRYKACKKENEIIHHKHILYGIDKVPGDKVVIVEGITDVWRLGPGAVATFGIKYTTEQLLLIAKRFTTILILFDNDPNAKKQALNMSIYLSGFNLNIEILEIDKEDPASLTEQESKEIMKLLT